MLPKNHLKIEKCGHSDQKYPKKFVPFGQKLVPFLLLSQLNPLRIDLQSKNPVFLESTHFGLSTGAKKITKMLKIEVAISKNIFNCFPKIT